MKAIEVIGRIDERSQLVLDSPLTIDLQSRVEVVVLVSKSYGIDADNLNEKEILGDLRQAWEVRNGKTILGKL